jgi:hypothetical protein
VTCGVLLTTSNAPWPLHRFEHVQIKDNLIYNPQSHGVTVVTNFDVEIAGNKMIPSVVTRSGVDYPTNGAAIYAKDVSRLQIQGNTFGVDSGGRFWPWVYDISGDTLTEKVKIEDNPNEEFSGALFVAYSAAIAAQLTYRGHGLSFVQAATPGAVAAGGSLAVVMGAPGALLGDIVTIGYDQQLSGLTLTAYVNAVDQVAAIFANNTGGGITPAAGNFRGFLSRRGA